MKALFAHDHVFMPAADGQVYSAMQLQYEIWQRYLEVFDEIVVVARSAALDVPVNSLQVSSGASVSFALIPDLQHMVKIIFKRAAVEHMMEETMAGVDAVIARVPSEIGGLAAAMASARGLPWAAEVIGRASDVYRHDGRWIAKLYAPVMERRTLRAIAQAPFVHYVTRDYLQQYYPSRGQTAAISDVEIPALDANILEQRQAKIRAQGGKLAFGLIGTLNTRYKGIQTAMEALAQVRHKLPPLELRLLGKGDATPWRQLAQSHGLADHLQITTLPPGEAVFRWLDDIDLYLQPSLTEGLPRALIEALSRACPAIGSAVGGIPELLPRECLHRPGDTSGLSRLILQAAHDRDWQLEQAERNFRTAERYQHHVLAEQRHAFWHSFAAYVRQVRGITAKTD